MYKQRERQLGNGEKGEGLDGGDVKRGGEAVDLGQGPLNQDEKTWTGARGL